MREKERTKVRKTNIVFAHQKRITSNEKMKEGHFEVTAYFKRKVERLQATIVAKAKETL